MVTLTQAEKDTINAEIEELSSTPDSSSLDVTITKKSEVDAVNKKFFDDDNLNIVGYENEKKQMLGDYPEAPVTESDIITAANFQGRLYNVATSDVYRHACFDGTPILHIVENETENKPLIYEIFDELQNGFPAISGLTTSAWSGGVGDSDSHIPNGKYIVGLAFVEVTNSVEVTPMTEYTITYIEIVSGVIALGDSIDNFSGFTHSERISKTTVETNHQGIMTHYLTELNLILLSLVSYLDIIVNALQGMTDTGLLAATLTAHTDYRVDINSYKATLDISNAEITLIKSKIDTRTSFIAIRVGEIDARLLILRDNRYNFSYSRSNSGQGSLTMQKRLQQSKASIDATAQAMTDQKEFYENNLPLV